MICPACKDTSHGKDDKFCYRDGTRLVDDEVKCACGNTLRDYDKFCGKCGKRKPESVTLAAGGN